MSLSLSPQIQKIIDDWYSHKLKLPSWFAQNNINWVISGHITESEFLTAFNNLLNSGIAYYVTEPTPEPEPEPLTSYWVAKASQINTTADYPLSQTFRAQMYSISNSLKQAWLDKGYILSDTQPAYQSGRVLWQGMTLFGKGLCTSKTGERYTQVISCTPPEPTPEPIPEPTPEPIPEPTPEPIPEPTPEPIPEPPQIDDSINTNMVTQQVINFNIVNGRAVGSIKFVATNNFNPYYYNKNIVNIIQIKDPNGVVLLTKENRLNFTETERDEVINYDEDVKQNTRATVESFVWEWMDKPAGAFSNKYSVDISEKEPPKPIQAGLAGAGVALSVIAGAIVFGFIADHKRDK